MLLSAMTLPVPIGISDFRELREKRWVYVDKTRLVREMIDRESIKVLLLPRPRRFGKTLNLTMLRCFFERRAEDLSHLFEDLEIWQAGERYRAHFQRYPVLFLTFRDMKERTYEETWAAIRRKVAALFLEHRFLLDAGILAPEEARDFAAVLAGTAEPSLYRAALGDLSRWLHRATGEKVVLLIDEYDQPIHAGYVNGYLREVLDFFRTFFTAGLKDNSHLGRAVLTGILRIAKESIFSGLNNIAVFSLLRSEFSDSFGFTEAEVVDLLARAGCGDRLEMVRAWYDGYDFGGTRIYNPWSILNFLADEKFEPRPYWVNTSSNDLVQKLLVQRATKLQPIFDDLLSGGGVERLLDEDVVLERLESSDDALFGLLVFSGYLRAEARPKGPLALTAHWLAIPNYEVRYVYTTSFAGWLRDRIEGRGGNIELLLEGLLHGDAEIVEQQLGLFVTDLLSYHDTGPAMAPERVYHAFIIGLLCTLEMRGYRVRSNRESGRGRPDVLLIPAEPGRPGAVLELKIVPSGRRAPEKVLRQALAQAREKGYAAEVLAAGASKVFVFGIALDGKKVWVRAEEP